MNTIVLTGIPIPPSINEQYIPLKSGRMIPSQKYKDYKRDFAVWVIANKPKINEAIELIRQWNNTLEISMYCCFERSRLITKDGRPKRIDISNRSKSLHDLISEALQIDDSIFVSTPMEKVVADGKEQTIVVIQPFEYRSTNDLMNSLELILKH